MSDGAGLTPVTISSQSRPWRLYPALAIRGRAPARLPAASFPAEPGRVESRSGGKISRMVQRTQQDELACLRQWGRRTTSTPCTTTASRAARKVASKIRVRELQEDYPHEVMSALAGTVVPLELEEVAKRWRATAF